jgi:hypothetical protein
MGGKREGGKECGKANGEGGNVEMKGRGEGRWK